MKHRERKKWFWFLTPLLLACAAFLGPQVILEMQDRIRCGESQLAEQEPMDITSFNENYETNLYKRMLRFAEGLSEGKPFYVAAQEMEPTQEIKDFLYSEDGLMQNQIYQWIDSGCISKRVLDCSLEKWKQYVIYGDDLSGGVYFILWYLELTNPAAPTLKLLMDAETGSVYGILAEQSEENLEAGERILNRQEGYSIYECLLDRLGITLEDMWIFAVQYGGLDKLQLNQGSEGNSIAWQKEAEERQGEYNQSFSSQGKDSSTFLYETNGFQKRGNVEIREDEVIFSHRFPYERQEGSERDLYMLRFILKTNILLVVEGKHGEYMFRPSPFILGFPDVYELIPEFAE